ncbi:hypothetical protein VDGD_09988 [Verticillium dahliae]|nr:hypothetical protein VDGD_09988 [Verticillium dahliae]
MSLDAHAQALSASLAKAKLVPGSADGLIPDDFAPATKLDVAYDGQALELGTFFRASQCKVPPSIAFAAEAGAAATTASLPFGGTGSCRGCSRWATARRSWPRRSRR